MLNKQLALSMRKIQHGTTLSRDILKFNTTPFSRFRIWSLLWFLAQCHQNWTQWIWKGGGWEHCIRAQSARSTRRSLSSEKCSLCRECWAPPKSSRSESKIDADWDRALKNERRVEKNCRSTCDYQKWAAQGDTETQNYTWGEEQVQKAGKGHSDLVNMFRLQMRRKS